MAVSEVGNTQRSMSEDPMNGRAYWRAATAALGLDRPDTAAALCMRGIKAALGEQNDPPIPFLVV